MARPVYNIRPAIRFAVALQGRRKERTAPVNNQEGGKMGGTVKKAYCIISDRNIDYSLSNALHSSIEQNIKSLIIRSTCNSRDTLLSGSADIPSPGSLRTA